MSTFWSRILARLQRTFFWFKKSEASEEHVPHAHDHALLLAVTSAERVPRFRQFRYAARVFSASEQRVAIGASVVLFVSLALTLGAFVYARTIRVPAHGGTFTEGLIGEPKYLNPIDAPANDVDRDIASLVYSGLFKMDGLNVTPDLAESYTWSDNGKTLTVILRSDVRFQNGTPVIADDVEFTIDSIQDPARSSPISGFFSGVHTTVIDDRTITFTQDQADVTLLAALTVGIVPSEIWQDIPAANARLADLNLRPIGSGPYRFKSFTRDSKGLIRSFTLEANDTYYGSVPYIKTVVFQFFADRHQAEEALKGDLIDGLAFADATAIPQTSTRWHHIHLDLPQETVAFFNTKQKNLSDERVRRALSGVIDRNEMIDAWSGRAVGVSGPFPFIQTTSTVLDLDAARALLQQAGWVLPKEGTVRVFNTSSTEFVLTITTSDQPELVASADKLQRRWSLLGAKVTVDVVPPEDLLRRATRDSKTQIILTNVLLGPDQDIFPFWWSGQATERGLNISRFLDRDIDSALELTRSASSTFALEEARQRAAEMIVKKSPAAFLVRPRYLYEVSSRINGVNNDLLVARPADRFQAFSTWYIKTGWRWR